MIIIETCPKCGHDLQDLVLATYPPIPQKKCFECGWEWTGEPEQIMRVPFGGNSFDIDSKYVLTGSVYNELVNVDDTGCMVNNINGYVFTASEDSLKNNTISYERIAEAIERTKKYVEKSNE
jgi:hypothetical protein